MMIASAKAGINEGIEYYQKRHEGSNGTLASVENINKAIEQFASALLTPESEKDAALTASSESEGDLVMASLSKYFTGVLGGSDNESQS